MPLPFIIGGIAAVAGVGTGIHGGLKMKKANDTMNTAKQMKERAGRRVDTTNKKTTEIMDSLGKLELEIMSSFDEFADIISKIQQRPEFKAYSKDGIDLPKFEAEELKKVGVGAGLLLGGLGGAAAGGAGGFAAGGAAAAAVMAFGTASTGTAISGLTGAALTNATLAALGGGAVAAGGGGMAIGTLVLGGATLGVGLLVGGVIFNITGGKLSDKADEAYQQALRIDRDASKICFYLDELRMAASTYMKVLGLVYKEYKKRLTILDQIVNFYEKTDWYEFTEKEKVLTENLVMLVGLLYRMCKVNLVIKSNADNVPNKVNKKDVEEMINTADDVIDQLDDI